jgi:hypothetical protein
LLPSPAWRWRACDLWCSPTRLPVRGIRVSEPLLGIDLSDPEAVQTGPLQRLLLPLNHRLAADISLSIRTLDIDPPLLNEALRYYHQHPRAAPNSRPRPDWHACRAASSPPTQPTSDRHGERTPTPVLDTCQPWDVSPECWPRDRPGRPGAGGHRCPAVKHECPGTRRNAGRTTKAPIRA